MTKQLAFIVVFLVTVGIFIYTVSRLVSYFRLTQAAFPVKDIAQRIKVTFTVAFGQTKIFRRPVIGLMHAFVFWGFCMISFGTIEIVLDGLLGLDKSLQGLGWLYVVISGSGDIFSWIIGVFITAFLIRRLFLHIRRFEGIGMKHISHLDANIALVLIGLLMVTLVGMNAASAELQRLSPGRAAGYYPFSSCLSGLFSGAGDQQINNWYEVFWWLHILIIFLFINVLPYSKHFHVFMSIPNVFLSRLDPPGKLPNMEQVTREVKLMLNPDTAFASSSSEPIIARFGVKDIEDVSWKNYLDSLACTECGRCTSVCPANITGKKLSPRKIIMDVRARMKEKGPGMVKQGKEFSDNRSLLRDYITEEELWACTTCNACAQECPININHPTLIVDMRRYLVMEEASAPGLLKVTFNNIENNGAPWQYSPEDRLNWARDLEMNVN
ncbi:MAG: 4Fe-4S dicluster domain-containing protein [Bacteroidetes bacterium]|nr:4Fe-4S dicluster domain-containing protein [Bacteroidota bacterium]